MNLTLVHLKSAKWARWTACSLSSKTRRTSADLKTVTCQQCKRVAAKVAS